MVPEAIETIRPDGRLTAAQSALIRAYLARRQLAAERALAHYTRLPAETWNEGTIRAQQHWLGVLAAIRWATPPLHGGD